MPDLWCLRPPLIKGDLGRAADDEFVLSSRVPQQTFVGRGYHLSQRLSTKRGARVRMIASTRRKPTFHVPNSSISVTARIFFLAVSFLA